MIGHEFFGLLWIFTTPCCAVRLGCFRPIFIEAFIEEFYLVTSLILVITAVFIEELTSSLLESSHLPKLFLKNLPRFLLF